MTAPGATQLAKFNHGLEMVQDMTYQRVAEKKNWNSAVQHCKSLGMKLAIVPSKKTNKEAFAKAAKPLPPAESGEKTKCVGCTNRPLEVSARAPSRTLAHVAEACVLA